MKSQSILFLTTTTTICSLFLLLLFPAGGIAFQIPFSNLLNPHQTVNNENDLSTLTPPPPPKRPNIVFILTDDQDLQMDSLKYTPVAVEQLMKKGTFYRNHFVTTALCCPSRVSLWTGRQPHNTNVTDVNPPYGGYPKFVSQGFNDPSKIGHLALWLQQQAGYSTYYTGKLFNAHTVDNYNNPHVSGFNHSDFLLDPYTYNYLNSSFQRDHEVPVSHEGEHSADVLAGKALGFLDQAIEGFLRSKEEGEGGGEDEKPFFLTVGTTAPHSNVEAKNIFNVDSDFSITAPIPPTRFAHLFPDAKVPRTPHFNPPDSPSGVNWIASLPVQNATNVAYNDHFYRNRLRVLQTVEELVGNVVRKLEDAGLLESTYIIYTSDNGYHIGQHRLQPGKECGFEEDIRVPLFIRGPGIAENQVVDEVTTHIDLAPTIFEIVGLPLREDFDGVPIPLIPSSPPPNPNQPKLDLRSDPNSNPPSHPLPLPPPHHPRHEHVTVEYWGLAAWEGVMGFRPGTTLPTITLNNTYKALRLLSPTYNLYYSVWCNNAHQLYDLSSDPYELESLFDNPNFESRYLLGRPLSEVVARLDALLLVTKGCKGWQECIEPWRVLHPSGDVRSLGDALDRKFDDFYRSQDKVEYSRCEFGYVIDAEGPQNAKAYTSRLGVGWSDWA
ncbi:MAG: hypothetical protein M1834_003351 [Cirrosporium novae-zelandiae]|nr:MAG: hypothetical protein M1834_003351 [Cirrosporium novae-zelandiae]